MSDVPSPSRATDHQYGSQQLPDNFLLTMVQIPPPSKRVVTIRTEVGENDVKYRCRWDTHPPVKGT
jgi:hypothetical protein